MIKKWLASVGIGSVRVDTQINGNQFVPGDQVTGEILIYGSDFTEEIEGIYLDLVIEYLKGKRNVRHVVKRYKLVGKILIRPYEEKRIPLSFDLPLDLPRSTGKFPIYLCTRLDIRMALDPQDQDRIFVVSSPMVQEVLTEIEKAGFVLIDVVNRHSNWGNSHYCQTFKYKPTGKLHGKLDKLHVSFYYTKKFIEIWFELYRSKDIVDLSIYWEHEDPSGTLEIDEIPFQGDPLLKIKEMLRF